MSAVNLDGVPNEQLFKNTFQLSVRTNVLTRDECIVVENIHITF